MDMIKADSMAMEDSTCKMSMTWNWYTTGTCFITKSWRIDSNGAFVASCLAATMLVVTLEFLHRVQREYDILIRRQDGILTGKLDDGTHDDASYSDGHDLNKTNTAIATGDLLVKHLEPRPRMQKSNFKSLQRQIIRSLLHMLQFSLAYLIMLLAMSFNGYIIISIIVGAFIGPFTFSWDQLRGYNRMQLDAIDVTSCCG